MSEDRSHGGGTAPEVRMEDIVAHADALHARSVELLDEVRASAVSPRARRGVYRQLSPVSAQKTCSNRKISPQRQEVANSGRVRNVPIGPFASSTYVSVSGTCPGSCVFKDSGCYAQTGSYGWKIRRLDDAASSMRPLDVIGAEAHAIDALFVRGVPQDGAAGGRDLRLHISGDVSCERGAQVLAQAVRRFQERGGGACWTYTHRWREVDEAAWGTVRALASVETADEAEEAIDRGHVPALTVETLSSIRGVVPEGSGMRVLPCRAETQGTTCVQCRLCLEPGLLAPGTAVGFALHGMGVASAAKKLRDLRASHHEVPT